MATLPSGTDVPTTSLFKRYMRPLEKFSQIRKIVRNDRRPRNQATDVNEWTGQPDVKLFSCYQAPWPIQTRSCDERPSAVGDCVGTAHAGSRRQRCRCPRRCFRDGLGATFAAAIDVIRAAEGRVIVTGMGKSGHVARKIASTFASTGTPAFFVHPGEASHGDLGMIGNNDVILALSWSGETAELKNITDYSRRYGIKLIAMTAIPESALAKVRMSS